MRTKETSTREPSHTPGFIRIVLIVLGGIVLLIAVAKLVSYLKVFGS